jgi:hypothetical protein
MWAELRQQNSACGGSQRRLRHEPQGPERVCEPIEGSKRVG